MKRKEEIMEKIDIKASLQKLFTKQEIDRDVNAIVDAVYFLLNDDCLSDKLKVMACNHLMKARYNLQVIQDYLNEGNEDE